MTVLRNGGNRVETAAALPFEEWAVSIPSSNPSRVRMLDIIRHGLMFNVTDLEKFNEPTSVKNYSSLDEVEEQMDQDILREMSMGRYIRLKDGRFPDGMAPKKVQARGAVAKSGTTKKRIYTDCAAPFGSSINEATTPHPFTMSHHDDAVRLLSPYAYMAKADISEAFRHVGIHKSLWPYHCFRWKGETYVDCCMTFGHTESGSFQLVCESRGGRPQELGD
jgi:hypothetical protein